MDFEIRKVRKAHGPMKLRREREEYFRLVRQGYSNKEASRLVGVNERTGREWRNGRSDPDRFRAPAQRGQAPVAMSSGRYLRDDERLHIADRLREKATIRAIAAELGRSPSTVSREIRRNSTTDPRGQRHYRPHAAQARADVRRRRPKVGKIAQNAELWDFIQHRLTLRWSPEQICNALRAQFPDRPEMQVVHETVYQALYVQGRGELRREVARALRSGRARRRPQRQAASRQPRFSDPMVMIGERPAEAKDRAVPGHWEGDPHHREGQRLRHRYSRRTRTRYVMLVHLPDGRTAEHMRDALAKAVQSLPSHLARLLTWDQGSEMAAHHAFSLATNVPVHFCDPASPWHCGSNENTNGLPRQYFPKGTDFSVHTHEHLAAVAAELNGPARNARLGNPSRASAQTTRRLTQPTTCCDDP